MNQEQGLQKSDFLAVPLFCSLWLYPCDNYLHYAHVLLFSHSLLVGFAALYSWLQDACGTFILSEGAQHQAQSEANAGNGAFLLEFADSAKLSSLKEKL